MNDLLLVWLSLSLSGSLVALLLLVSSPLLQRFGRTWKYYLWLLVILRWLVPFSPDVSIVGGLFAGVEELLPAQVETVEIEPGGEFSEGLSPPIADGLDKSHSQQSSGTGLMLSILQVHFWGALWLFIATVLLTRKAVGYAKFSAAVKRESLAIADGSVHEALQMIRKEMGIQKKIHLASNPLVKAPLLVGFLTPTIVLPKEDLPPAQLHYIFRHELTHEQRIDFLYKWITEITVCLHWFNPFAYWVRKQIHQDCEFSCDEMVVSSLGRTERRTYGETLLDSIVPSDCGRTDGIALSLSQDGKLIGERLRGILQYHPKNGATRFAAAVSTLALVCISVYTGSYTALAESDHIDHRQDNPIQNSTVSMQTVVYEHVSIRHSENNEAFDYIVNTRANNTGQKIVSCDRGMLAFDQEGNPLELDWWVRDDEQNRRFLWQHGGLSREVLPGEKDEQAGGWRLNAADPQVKKVAYVLFCDSQITFADGTVWENPEYTNWLSAYEGKKIDINIFESYYPYQEVIAPAE